MLTASALQAVIEHDAPPCQPGPAKRKRLLVLPALPSAPKPRSAEQAPPGSTTPLAGTSAEAPHAQFGAGTAAAHSVPLLTLSVPLSKQPQRQLETPFAHLPPRSEPAPTGKAAQDDKPTEATVERPHAPETVASGSLARPVPIKQQALVPQAAAPTFPASAPLLSTSTLTPAKAIPLQPSHDRVASALAAQQANRSTARVTSLEMAAPARPSADSTACSEPAATDGAQQECLSRPTDDVTALVIEVDHTPEPLKAATAPLSACGLAAGLRQATVAAISIAQPAGAGPQPPHPSASSQGHAPPKPSNDQAAASAAQHLQHHADLPASGETSRLRNCQAQLQEALHQPSPRSAACAGRAKMAMLKPSTSRRSEMPATKAAVSIVHWLSESFGRKTSIMNVAGSSGACAAAKHAVSYMC